MCYWRDGVNNDDMKWIIKSIADTKSLPHGPTESEGFDKFLFVDFKPDGHDITALIKSPYYHDTAVSCTVSYEYYIAGNLNESVITVALRRGDIDLPIDFLHGVSETTGSFQSRVTTVGRRDPFV